jgi:hypothetical protein
MKANKGLRKTETTIVEVDRTYNTWAKGNPYLAEALPKPPPLLKSGERFFTEEEQAKADAEYYQRPEDNPKHPDYGVKVDVPLRSMLDSNDPCIEFYGVWCGGYVPVLSFFSSALPTEKSFTAHPLTIVTSIEDNVNYVPAPVKKRGRGRPPKKQNVVKSQDKGMVKSQDKGMVKSQDKGMVKSQDKGMVKSQDKGKNEGKGLKRPRDYSLIKTRSVGDQRLKK